MRNTRSTATSKEKNTTTTAETATSESRDWSMVTPPSITTAVTSDTATTSETRNTTSTDSQATPTTQTGSTKTIRASKETAPTNKEMAAPLMAPPRFNAPANGDLPAPPSNRSIHHVTRSVKSSRRRAEAEARLKLAQQKLEEARAQTEVIQAQLELAEIDSEEELDEEMELEKSTHVERWVEDVQKQIEYEPVRPEKKREKKSDVQLLAKAIIEATKSSSQATGAVHLQELPTFSGNIEEWIGFKKQYEDTARSFSALQNMARLRKYVQGAAKEMVKSLLLTSSNPDEVINVLERRYGRPDVIVLHEIEKIKRHAPLSDTPREICTFASKINNVVATIKALKKPQYLHSPELCKVIVEKLTAIGRYRWLDFRSRHIEEEPELIKIDRFLSLEADLSGTYAPPEIEKPRNTRYVNATQETKTSTPTTDTFKKYCTICTEEHWITECRRFLDADTDEKWKMAMENKLCFRCLRKRHQRFTCRSPPCKRCKKNHHTMLHSQRITTEDKNKEGEEKVTTTVCATATATSAYLKMVPVEIYGPKASKKIIALLDEGSTITLLDESTAKEIGVNGTYEPLNIKTICGGQAEEESLRVNLKIRGLHRQDKRSLENVRTIKNLKIPPQYLDLEDIEACNHLQPIRNEIVYKPEAPKMIIGQDNWGLIVSRKIIKGRRSQPAASLTSLGWVLHGVHKTGSNSVVHFVNHCTDEDKIEEMLKFQFSIDCLGVEPKLPSTDPEEKAKKLLEETTKRLPNGRFEASLLWEDEQSTLPNNRSQALRRLKSIQMKLSRDEELKKQYEQQIDNLIKSGYAEEAPPVRQDHKRTFYLSHFAVTHPTKKKIRIVFDAAARYDGRCLNDVLLSGPDQLQSLFGVLLRFREKPYAIMADIKEMFLQIKIREEDRDSLRFLWSQKPQDRVKEYRMTSVIFGAKSSPAIAIFVKNKNAEEHADQYPEAYAAIVRNHYMDDFLKSFKNREEARKVAEEVDHVHKLAGFQLRGWASNDESLARCFTEEEQKTQVTLGQENKEKTLGLLWLTKEDAISFNVEFRNIPSQVITGEKPPTKRQVMSACMSTFDPLGLVTPVLIQGKKLIQLLWRLGVDWDEEIQEEPLLKWREYVEQVKKLQDLKIPRSLTKTTTAGELHIFVDASEQAYAAVAYWRSVEEDGSIRVALIAGKAKVAPNKPTSMPRLELQAALMGSRLADTIIKETDLQIKKKTFWSDSSTVLRWIGSDLRKYKTFVAFRLAEIEELTKKREWRWVPTRNNAADDATRETPKDFCERSRWFTGPEFLYEDEDSWPANKFESPTEEPNDEEKNEVVTTIQKIPPNTQEKGKTEEWSTSCTPDEERFSTWKRLLRSTARILQFIELCRKKSQVVATSKKDEDWKPQSKKKKKTVTKIAPRQNKEERRFIPIEDKFFRRATTLLIKKVQEDCFAEEINSLTNDKPRKKTGKISKFDIYLDEDGVIRMKGRIQKISGIEEEAKTPPIMDGRHRITRLLIEDYHRRCYHGNHATVMNEIRQLYYVTRLRTSVRRVIQHCQWCKIRKAEPQSQPTGDLPKERLQHHKRPFTFAAVDYFGPMKVAIGRRQEKRWGVLFTCLTTRAIHLELAASLNTSSMIMALRRMIARRGTPATIYSDNGTNFIGAERELQEELQKLRMDEVISKMSGEGMTWKKIPPGAPQMGGAWERLVKTVKIALYAVLKERVPTEETLHTLLTEVEHTVNSRPLTTVSVDPTEEESLTPNHFLLGKSNGAPIVGTFEDITLVGKTDWRAAQRLADHFWNRWLKEYLPELLPRRMNNGEKSQLRIGDIVIIIDRSLPRNVWPRGEIVKTLPGPDGRIRIAEVRTTAGILRRPVSRLVVIVPASSRPEDGVSHGGETVSDECMRK